MASNLGSGVVTIRANLAPLRTALVSARYQLSSFVAGTRTIGQVAGFLAGNFLVSGVITLARAFGSAGQAAADMGESINKLQVIFGASSKSVRDFADEIADRLGLAKIELLDAASAFGAIGRGAGMGAKNAAAFSREMVQLAIDMRSVVNVPFEVMVKKLQSGLAGTTRPLREYGVQISADAVKQEAFRLGLIKTGQALNEKAKVIARASVEFRKMRFAEGDAAATAESTANLQVSYIGRIRNAQAELGKAMQPIWHGIAYGINEGAKSLQGFLENNKANIYAWSTSIVDAFTTFKQYAGEFYEAIRPSLEELSTAFSKLWASISTGQGGIVVLKTGFDWLVGSVKLFVGALTLALNVLHSMSDAVVLLTDAITGDWDKFHKDRADIKRGRFIDNEVPVIPVEPPPEPERAEGQFDVDRNQPAAHKGKKGTLFQDFNEFFKGLQGGAGDIPKKQLDETQKGNKVLNDILGEMKKKADPMALAR